MKKLILLGCLLLSGCSEPSAELIAKTAIFDHAAASPIEKIIISDEKEARIIRNPKQTAMLIQNLKQLNASDIKPIASDTFIEIMYEDGSNELFTFDDQNICSSACAAWDKESILKLSDGFDTKHIIYAEVPEFLEALFAGPLQKAVYFKPCDAETCPAEQLDEAALFDFQAYLRMLDFGRKAEQPEGITDYFRLTVDSSAYLLAMSLSDEGFVIGMDDEWVSFQYQDAVLSSQLAGIAKKAVSTDNPTYRKSTVFDEGIGAELEIYGFIYDEETHTFILEGNQKVTISESMIQIKGETISSYHMLSETAQFNAEEKEACTYYLNAQESEGCTLEEAKANYLKLLNEIDLLLGKMKLTLIDVKAFMLDQKEARFMEQVAEAYPKLEAEKPMLGNVSDLDKYFQQLGYTKNEFVYSKEVSDPYLGDVILSYHVKDLLFKVQQENSVAQLRLGSDYGEGADGADPEKMVCTLDFISETVLGECSKNIYYAQPGRHLNARHALIGWQHQLSLSDEELLQYAEMINEQ